MLVLILINWLVNSIWAERQLRHSLFFPFVLREKIASFRVYCSNKTQHWGQSVEFDLFRFIFIFVFGARGICIEFPMIDSENLKVWRPGDLFPAVTKSCAMDQKLWVLWAWLSGVECLERKSLRRGVSEIKLLRNVFEIVKFDLKNVSKIGAWKQKPKVL